MIETIRRLIDEKCNLSTSAQNIAPDFDLHQAGLTPLMATQLMLALEKEFEVEFPEQMLTRRNLSSIDAILTCIRELQQRKAPPGTP